MAIGHHHTAVPLVARQFGQFWIVVDFFGGNGKIGIAIHHHVAYGIGWALFDRQLYFWKARHKVCNDFRQHIARLRMGGGDGE